ncbi:MAG: hydrogenobyrinic acid a,c-diamide synthase (glutamine-hydrolyzing) [Gammaproteobacteria bacterium]
MKRILISAAHKSSGKTTLSIGLCAALTQRGLSVQPFKKGPDYIDPMWLGRAAKSPCYNLDFYTMTRDEIINKFSSGAQHADISLIEGNKGLYDGLDLDGSNSNAALANLLKTPVILVIDVQGMTRGIAPLILGYQAFDKDINIAGIILNQVRGKRHETKLRDVIAHYTDVPVIGAVSHDPEIAITERHLGLIPSNEQQQAEAQINQIANIISDQVDLDALIAIAANAPELQGTYRTGQTISPGITVRIGIARDEAFGFYYADDLQALENAGAELVDIDMLSDPALPDVDGLFIGGGFPETRMQELSANKSMRKSVFEAIEAGLPTYAECGGLMYLTKSITWKDQHFPMVGSIQADTIMHKRPQGRGYTRLQATGSAPWSVNEGEFAAHEFHYSSLQNLPDTMQFAYKVLRGNGIDGKYDGIVYKNLLACYTHLRHTENTPWAEKFVTFVRSLTEQK